MNKKLFTKVDQEENEIIGEGIIWNNFIMLKAGEALGFYEVH